MKKFFSKFQKDEEPNEPKFLAEALESRTLYSAAPVDISASETVDTEQVNFDLSEVGEFQSIHEFGTEGELLLAEMNLEIGEEHISLPTRFVDLPAQQVLTFSELDEEESQVPKEIEEQTLAFSNVPEAKTLGEENIVRHLDDLTVFDEINQDTLVSATTEITNVVIFTFDTLGSLTAA